MSSTCHFLLTWSNQRGLTSCSVEWGDNLGLYGLDHCQKPECDIALNKDDEGILQSLAGKNETPFDVAIKEGKKHYPDQWLSTSICSSKESMPVNPQL